MKLSEVALHVGCGDVCCPIETIGSDIRCFLDERPHSLRFVDSQNSSSFQAKTLVLKSIKFHYQLKWL